MEIDNLVAIQLEEADDLETKLKNFKKDGKSRKKQPRLETINGEVDQVWEILIARHDEILKADPDKTHEYFAEDFVSRIQGVYNEFKNRLIVGMKECKVKTSLPLIAPVPQTESISQNGPKIKSLESRNQLLRYYLDKFEKRDKNTSSDSVEAIIKRVESHYENMIRMYDQLSQDGVPLGYDLEGEIGQLTDRFQAAIMESEIMVSSPAEQLQHAPGSMTGQCGLQLPRIVIPKFDGQLRQWPEFRDLFETMVHENQQLYAIQKFQYLKNNVSGPAAEVIKHLPVIGHNYEPAWAALKRRFDNRNALVDYAWSLLLTQKLVTSENSAQLKMLLDSTKEAIYLLASYSIAVHDSLAIYIISTRLPKESRTLWEFTRSSSTSMPTFAEIENFMESRFRVLDTLPQLPEDRKDNKSRAHVSTDSSKAKKLECSLCHQGHVMFKCSQFRGLSPQDKMNHVNKTRLCHLCLRDHSTKDCPTSWKCFTCKGDHNTLLHEYFIPQVSANSGSSSSSIILATATLSLTGLNGQIMSLRALVDQGSMNSFISERAVRSLGLKRSTNLTTVTGIGGNTSRVRGETEITFSSVFSHKTFSLTPLILPTLTSKLPVVSSERHPQYDKLLLADKNYNVSGRIDLILGADIFRDLLLPGVRKGPLLAQKTHLGWILSGASRQDHTVQCYSVQCSNDELNESLCRFWEYEEKIQPTSDWSNEERECEKFYVATTTRGKDGRYICRLPFKANRQLGRSKHIALANMFQLERRFKKNPELKLRYVDCMREYISLRHAIIANKSESDFQKDGNYHCYYIPHLAVIKDSSLTTKTRVVFNASSNSSNGRSLNDVLMVGPVIQRDIVDKITRFRQHRHVVVCDITKMYRQINMHPDDCEYQRILWRENENMPIKEYKLTTVTFGESSAPFTAIRTLMQIAIDNALRFPLASSTLQNDCYVDDLHYGGDSIADVIKGRNELISCLSTAGMQLRKWASNNEQLLNDIPVDHRDISDPQQFMGILWYRKNDVFSYSSIDYCSSSNSTKRVILSQIASIYDPLGWIQPLIMPAKMIMQRTWKLKLNWDDALPSNLLDLWKDVAKSLSQIGTLEIPRWIGWSDNEQTRYELHGFADASQAAYGAVIYLRIIRNVTPYNICLLVAKSRIAPVKSISIPRLELKGALLISELMAKVEKALDFPVVKCAWLDSKVALCWINESNSERWVPFVRNRVAAIHENAGNISWQYVQSAENPADLVSRGCDCVSLKSNSMWWQGPHWLKEKICSSNKPILDTESDRTAFHAEERKVVSCAAIITTETNHFIERLIENNSSYLKILRITAWVRRVFLQPTKRKELPTYITVPELKVAELDCIRCSQLYYYDDIRCLKSHRLPHSSPLLPLNPFLDEHGLLRVGGRLDKSPIPYDRKHPYILAHTGLGVETLIRYYHDLVLHGGHQQTLNRTRERFWIIKGVTKVKEIIRKCVRCQRYQNSIRQQIMGDLPRARTELIKPFLHTGVDFCGPFYIRSRPGKGIKSTKAYVALFVCLSVKAIHVELVSSLSTDMFMCALKRFVARRGTVTNMYSDNGTTFVGCFRQLEKLEQSLATEGITWKFIPPYSPNFGGLWEAGVKSLKTQLKRVIGDSTYTYEEFTTILIQIESCLNARPLCPVDNNLENIDVLTPQHFLTGHAFVPVAEAQLTTQPQTKRWQLVQFLYQEICRRYKNEYLHRLQQRPKWHRQSQNLQIGQMVLVKEDQSHISDWPMGRVVQIHPGKDGIVRVATVRMAKGTFVRPVCKLSLLPIMHGDSPNTA